MLGKHSLLLLIIGFIGIVLVSTGLFFNPFNNHSLINNSVNNTIASNNSSVDSNINNDSVGNYLGSPSTNFQNPVNSNSESQFSSNPDHNPTSDPGPNPGPSPTPDPDPKHGIPDGNYSLSHLLFDIKYLNVTNPSYSLEYFNNNQHDSLITSLFIDNDMITKLINGNYLSDPLLFDDGFIHRNLIGDISYVSLIVKNGTYYFDTIYVPKPLS
ncbi:MAG: hypothetical protein LBV42_01930 [Methanobrevibacter sp.]|jgi:hypothetical protein|nr:hypothetical protein [Methanobrevibacter sp.]